MSLLLAEQSWPDLEGRTPLVVLPLGACEQHGPHLPMETDAAVATAVAWRAVQELSRRVDVLLAPTQTYAASGEHEGFPGTVSIGNDALRMMLVELGRSMLRWAGRLLIVNAHGGNVHALTEATTLLRTEKRDAAWWACSVEGADAHAGRTETALVMALQPLAVRTERAVAGHTEPIDDLLPMLQRTPLRGISPNGVLGDPAGASSTEGERLLDALAARLTESARAWRVSKSGRLASRAALEPTS
jgi:creatinine amidohydrolase